MQNKAEKKSTVGRQSGIPRSLAIAGGVIGATILLALLWGLRPWGGTSTDRPKPSSLHLPIGEGIGENRKPLDGDGAAALLTEASGNHALERGSDSNSERVELFAPVLTGTAEAPDGEPIANAIISMCEIRHTEVLGNPRWRRIAEDVGGRGAVWAQSNAEGQFEFANLPPGGQRYGFALWATHSEHIAEVRVLGPDPRDWKQDAKLVLTPGTPMRVTVVDFSGAPVEGAVIRHSGVAPPSHRPLGLPGFDEDRLRALLVRTMTTGRSGEIAVGPFPGAQALLASRGELVSETWVGAARMHVPLELASSFLVEGTILAPEAAPGEDSEWRLTFAAQKGAVVSSLGSISNVNVGPWGPRRLPILDVDGYVIRIEGAPLIPEEVISPVPIAGARLGFELEARTGETLWFMAVGEEEQGLPEAAVLLTWYQNGIWVTSESQARSDAYIRASGTPAGLVYYYVFAPGYAPDITSPLGVPLSEPKTIVVQLERSAGIVGTCMHSGAPVQDFEVVIWPVGSPKSRTLHAFHGRVEGTFEIADAPVGEVFISAASALFPGSEPMRIPTRAGETARVALELPVAKTGRGIVVDARSGNAISDATIQLYYAGHDGAVARWGLPHNVDSDGRFEIIGFTDRSNFYYVYASGYSGHYASLLSNESDLINVGEIRLHPLQSLELVLTSSEPGTKLGTIGYRLRSQGMTLLPATAFPDDGVLRFDNVSAGQYTFGIDHPSGVRQEFWENLEAGGDWRIEHRVEGRTTLAVHLVLGGNDRPEERYLGEVSYVTPGGRMVSAWKEMGKELTVTFPGVDAQTAQASIFRVRDLEHLAMTRCDLRGKEFVEVSLALDSRLLRVHVVNASGDRLSDVRVDLEDVDQRHSLYYGMTNANGTANLLGVPEALVLAHLHSTSVGRHSGIPCDATGDEVTLVFDPSASLDLRVSDNGERLPNVQCWILDTMGLPDAAVATDTEGRARFARLGVGTYEISLVRHDCWPVTTGVTVSPDQSETHLQLRRLGDVTIEVVTAEGQPVRGAGLSLRSVEFETDVASWIADRRVRCEGGLVTDRGGEVTIEGLPRGRYAWSVEGGSGELDVRPGMRSRVRLELP